MVCLILNLRDEIVMLLNCYDDVRCFVLWSLENGLEIICIVRGEDILLFVCF